MAGDDLSLLGGLLYGLDALSRRGPQLPQPRRAAAIRRGEKLFDDKVTIYSDPMNAEVPGNAFDGDGLPSAAHELE
ncbi:MAG: hypothetical protein WKG07_16065 [Hymenobacter sp.]